MEGKANEQERGADHWLHFHKHHRSVVPPYFGTAGAPYLRLHLFKERFLPKDHPDRSKMNRFSAKLHKLGLREETIGYGPSKEKWEAWNQERS